MRRLIATAVLGMGTAVACAQPALALDRQARPAGAQVAAQVAVMLFPTLPPGPCLRVPTLGFVGNPVLPPNPCLLDGRGAQDASF